MNNTLILTYPGNRDSARQAWLGGEAMQSQRHGLISRHTAGEFSPASILIQCQGGKVVTYPWPLVPKARRRAGCGPTLAVVGLLAAGFGVLWALS